MEKCICPNCSSENNVQILYGEPTYEAFVESKAGKLHLGGCCISMDIPMPDRYCNNCGHDWCIEEFDAKDITKVRFRYWSNWGCYDPNSTEENQWVYEVLPDGTIKYFAYPRAGRRVLDKDVINVSADKAFAFFETIVPLYRPWMEIMKCDVCDGYCYELTITFKDKRKKKINLGLGGITLNNTVMDFLMTIPEIKEKVILKNYENNFENNI